MHVPVGISVRARTVPANKYQFATSHVEHGPLAVAPIATTTAAMCDVLQNHYPTQIRAGGPFLSACKGVAGMPFSSTQGTSDRARQNAKKSPADWML